MFGGERYCWKNAERYEVWIFANCLNSEVRGNNMDIFFSKSSVEDDSASIVNLLCLGTEHQRVKKYICEYFDLPIEELAKKVKLIWKK